MELNISIASTSFLLPKNPAWRALSDFGCVSFADYGDYSGAFLRSAPDEPLVFVLFVQDLLRDPDVATADAEYGLLEPLIALIEQRIVRSTAPTIIAAASWLPRSVISSAQSGDLCEVMGLELWRSLHRFRESSSNVFTINLDRYLGAEGFTRAFDARNWYFAHCRLSQHGLSTVAKLVTSVLERLSRPRKKVLVLDCDNTLWGGVVGEDGVDGIALGEEGVGAAYVDFQRASKRLAENGVLLALSSKNNEAEVWEVFDRHASMVLTRSDVVSVRINWSEKAANLREIADELDLSLDSFVLLGRQPFRACDAEGRVAHGGSSRRAERCDELAARIGDIGLTAVTFVHKRRSQEDDSISVACRLFERTGRRPGQVEFSGVNQDGSRVSFCGCRPR